MLVTDASNEDRTPLINRFARQSFGTVNVANHGAYCGQTYRVGTAAALGNIPGMPHGKPAGMRCVQLDDDARCRIFGRPERPAVCASLRPSPAMCGDSRAHAMRWLALMEQATQPSTPR